MPDRHEWDFQAAVSISPAHASAIGARMRTVEEDCREILGYLEGSSGVFSEISSEFSEATQQRIHALILEILESLVPIRLDLGLRKQQVGLRNLVNARLSRIWVTLHESKAQSLRGYGAVPEELKAYLDPRMDELLKLVHHLRKIVEAAETQVNAGADPGSTS